MGVYSYALKGLKIGATKLAQKLSGQGKTKFTGKAINTTKPGTQLTKKRRSQDDFTNFRSKLHTSAGFDTATKNKLKMKHPLYKTMKKTSDIFTPKEPKFNKGGRVEYKKGTGLMKKKSNVDKIKKTFGTLSVRAGIDNNPNPTYADKIAGAKMKNKNKKKFV